MEIRKVQLTGGSSYVVTLPKEWIKKLNIKKNDSLALITQSDGTLLINADVNRENTKSAIDILIKDNEDPEFILRQLVGSYISGYTRIKIMGNKRIPIPIRNVINEFLDTANSLMVDEETLSSIFLKDILNPAEMPYEKSIKRMNILIQSMQEDLLISLKENKIENIDSIITRDREINKRHWLIARQTNMALRDIIFIKKMGTTLEDAHYNFLISKQLERIGDHTKIMGENFKTLIVKDINGDLIKLIEKTSEVSMSIVDDSILAWQKNNLKLANSTLNRIIDVFPLCENLVQSEYGKNNKDLILSLNRIGESIKRIAEHGGNIAEIAINKIIKNQGTKV